jgi:hypothetical protein
VHKQLVLQFILYSFTLERTKRPRLPPQPPAHSFQLFKGYIRHFRIRECKFDGGDVSCDILVTRVCTLPTTVAPCALAVCDNAPTSLKMRHVSRWGLPVRRGKNAAPSRVPIGLLLDSKSCSGSCRGSIFDSFIVAGTTR